MAASQFTNWSGTHKLGTYLILKMNYAVYADMSNTGATPYLLLDKCRVRSSQNVHPFIGDRAPMTIKIKINNTGTTYTFKTGKEIKNKQGSYYYIDFSSDTKIPVPKNGTEFTIDITITTKNNETYTITEHAAGPVPLTVSGSKSIKTGAIATYTLSQPVVNDERHCVEAIMHTYFTSANSSGGSYNGYADTYTPVNYKTTPFTTVSFVPMRGEAKVGDVAKANANNSNYVLIEYYYYTNDESFGSAGAPLSSYNTNRILLSSIRFGITTTARAEVNSALKAEFIRFEHRAHGTYIGIDEQIETYGGVAQNQGYYDTDLIFHRFESDIQAPYPPYYSSQARLKYGSGFTRVEITNYLKSTTASKTLGAVGALINYDGGIIQRVGKNLTVRYKVTDSFGFTSTYSDIITVLFYEDPVMPVHSVRRCSLSATGAYVQDGVHYAPDDYGEYVLIEWSVRITGLDDTNSKSLTIYDPPDVGMSGMHTTTVSLPSYVCSGYYVRPADTETSYEITFLIGDDFHTYAKRIKYVEPLNTILALIDLYRGGTGLAFGKVAEEPFLVDIHRDWVLKMPYNTYVQNYQSSGASVNLYDWMQQVDNRMTAIANNRPYAIWYRGQFYDGGTTAVVPSGGGSVTYPYGPSNAIDLSNMTRARTGALLITPGAKVNRRYLFLYLSVAGFVGSGWDKQKPLPKIYILTSKPTSINQTTGVPNGTVKITRSIDVSIYEAGSEEEGLRYCDAAYQTINIDVSSYIGQNIWIAITTTNGGQSQTGYYQYKDAGVSVYRVLYSNTQLDTRFV